MLIWVEKRLSCHLSLFRAGGLKKQGVVQNIFSLTATAKEGSPVDTPRAPPAPNASDKEEKAQASVPPSFHSPTLEQTQPKGG